MPFELNAKLKYGFQLSESYRAVCLSDDFDYVDKRDSHEAHDLGICLTVVVSLTPASEGQVKAEVDGTTIDLEQGDALVMKSRSVKSYGLRKHGKKTIAIVYWVNGPKDTREGKF